MRDADLVDLDLYALLGVSPTAKGAEIRAAYRRRARESHPDLNPLDPASGARMTRLNRAVRILLEPSRRAAYDRSRGITGSRRVAESRANAAWYDHSAGGNDWDAPHAAPTKLTVAARHFRRRVRRSHDALALNAGEWLLGLQQGERLLLAGLLLALGSGLLMWARPVNAFWTSPASDTIQVEASRR